MNGWGVCATDRSPEDRAKEVESHFSSRGVKVWVSCGEAAGQRVPCGGGLALAVPALHEQRTPRWQPGVAGICFPLAPTGETDGAMWYWDIHRH